MARKPSGFGKPKLKRTEPREIEPSAAAPEPPTLLHEPVRCDNSEPSQGWQSDCPSLSGDSPRVKPWRKRTKSGTRKRRGPRLALSDGQWRRVRRFVYGEPGKPGRNAKNNRMKLDGMLWILRTGAPWRDMPEEFGDWSNIYHTFRRWAQREVFLMMFLSIAKDLDLRVVMVDGTFIKVHKHGVGAPRHGLSSADSQVKQAIGRSRGGLTTKLMALVDRRGRLVTFTLVPGNVDEGRQLGGLLTGIDVAEIDELLGDKAFDSDAIRTMLGAMVITATVPSKRNRKVPIPHDKYSYKGRHLVENWFVDIKEFRGISTRYCKYAATFCAGFHLVTWYLRTRGRKLRSSKYLER